MIHDITVAISSDMPVYPGDPEVRVMPVSRISEGAGANVSALMLGSHTGTHVDPPYHFIQDGAKLDEIPLDMLVGECWVCDMGQAACIGISELEVARIPAGTERILFKTPNSGFWSEREFRADFTYLDPEAAGHLVEQGIRLVGVDYLSVDKFRSGGHATHLRLLASGVVVVEGLDLRAVPQGMYTLVCLPLKVAGGDGGPARVILIE
jgi:arylformamidase